MLVYCFYSQLFYWDFQFCFLGQSYLYTSLSEKNPGPSSKKAKRNTVTMSPRTLFVGKNRKRGENVSVLLLRENPPKLRLR